jgi:hypothetical protein
MKQLGICFFLLCLTFFISQSDGSANVHVEGSVIVDESGRIRLYHGVNFVNKGIPWYPPELLDPVNVANLSQWGVNFVRLGYDLLDSFILFNR